MGWYCECTLISIEISLLNHIAQKRNAKCDYLKRDKIKLVRTHLYAKGEGDEN